MFAQVNTKIQSLYKIDYNLWVLETVQKLQNRDFASLDLENLIDEVIDLSRRDKRKLENLLTRLIEHLLKLAYWDSERERNIGHWQGEIRAFRKQIKKELRSSPSLKNYCQEIFEESYQDAKEIVSDKSLISLDKFPKLPIAKLEQILDENWFPQ